MKGMASGTGQGGNPGEDTLGWPLLWLWMAGIAILYVLTLRPTIGWYDTPEFPVAAYTLGIPHPPGSPTYVLLGKLASLGPVGGIGLRLNLFSAFCALAALILLYRAIVLMNTRIGGTLSAGRLGGILGATLLAVAPTYWSYATQAEVYAPFALIVALLLYLALRWDLTRDFRILLLGAFAFGLSGGIHGTAIFFAPALAFLVLTGIPRHRMLPTIGWVLVFGLLGASVYLYLPIRAAAEPALNWGHPDSLERFLSVVSDRKDAAYHFPFASKPWWPYIRQFFFNLNAELTPIGWLAGLCGLGLMLWRAPRLAVFTVLFCLGNLLFFLQIWTIPDGYIPTFFLVAFWSGVSLAWLLAARRFLSRLAAFATCGVILVLVAGQTYNGSLHARARANDSSRYAAEQNYLPLPENALVFVTAHWFPFLYLQNVEGMRPDITILLASDLTRPDNFTPLSEARFPNLRIPEGDQTDENWEAFFQEVLRENLGRMPVYWEPLKALNPNVYAYLHPWRYLWEFDPGAAKPVSREEAEAYLDELRSYLRSAVDMDQSSTEWAEGEAKLGRRIGSLQYHSYMLNVSAELLKQRGYPLKAMALVELAAELTPNDPTVANDLARYYSVLKRWDDAERMFRQSARHAPGDPTPLLNLAVMQMSLGRLEAAGATLAAALKRDPASANTHYQMSVFARKAGRIDQAREMLARALDLTDDPRSRRAWRKELAGLKTGSAS
ncbi:MAG: protein O-mannosyl-transferase family [Myxococcota bacterium]